MSSYNAFALTIAAATILAACAPEESAAPPEMPATAPPPAAPSPATPPADTAGPALPQRIVAERGGFIPEGVEFDVANGRFLTGSLAEGSIFEIGLDGSVTAIVTDPELVSSVGIEVDEPRDRILVANSDASVFQPDSGSSGQAKLGAYSLTTGQRLAMVDMGATLSRPDAVFFANDVAVADNGVAYATDTRQNVLYRVDTNYQAAVFYEFPPTEGLALNGIVYHSDGYLLVADLGNGALYKTPIANPSATSMVTLPEALNGADGIVWRADGALAVVQNSQDGRVVALTSSDGWSSAQIAGIAPHRGQATTAAAAGDAIYVVQPHFADQDPPSIERSAFQ